MPENLMEREVIRCEHCQLNQFMTANQHCRRCRQPLVELEPEPEPVMTTEIALEPIIGFPGLAMSGAVKMLRLAQGLSQLDLAERMGVVRTYISKLESNRMLPNFAKLPRLAQALGVTVYGLILIAERIP